MGLRENAAKRAKARGATASQVKQIQNRQKVTPVAPSVTAANKATRAASPQRQSGGAPRAGTTGRTRPSQSTLQTTTPQRKSGRSRTFELQRPDPIQDINPLDDPGFKLAGSGNPTFTTREQLEEAQRRQGTARSDADSIFTKAEEDLNLEFDRGLITAEDLQNELRRAGEDRDLATQGLISESQFAAAFDRLDQGFSGVDPLGFNADKVLDQVGGTKFDPSLSPSAQAAQRGDPFGQGVGSTSIGPGSGVRGPGTGTGFTTGNFTPSGGTGLEPIQKRINERRAQKEGFQTKPSRHIEEDIGTEIDQIGRAHV